MCRTSPHVEFITHGVHSAQSPSRAVPGFLLHIQTQVVLDCESPENACACRMLLYTFCAVLGGRRIYHYN